MLEGDLGLFLCEHCEAGICQFFSLWLIDGDFQSVTLHLPFVPVYLSVKFPLFIRTPTI